MHKFKFKLAVSICWILFLFSASVQSAQARGNFSAQQLKAKIDQGTPIFLLNPLSDIEFNEAHIPGSVNIPLHTIMKTDKLPKDKDELIVTYCKGPK